MLTRRYHTGSRLLDTSVYSFIVSLMLAGCSSPRTIERVRTEYRALRDVQVDTFWRDRFRLVYLRGDTTYVVDSVVVEKIHWRDRHDTLHVRDSIPVPYPVEKEVPVEKPLNWWQRFRIGGFWWLLILAAVGWRKQLLWLIKKAAGLFG